DAVRAVDGVEAVFESLRSAGARVAITSGLFAPIVEAILGRLGWLDDGLVDTFVTSDDVPLEHRRPNAIFEIMRRLQLRDARGVAKVGDTPFDLLEGQAAGVGWNVGVTYGTYLRDQLA